MNFLQRSDEFHELARRATGCDEFGPSDYLQPLQLLLSDYDTHNRLSEVGEQLLANDIVARLCGRLRAFAGFRQYPAYAAARTQRPLIIVGMARSGTTTLHRLLAQDPRMQWLALWLAASPRPRPPPEAWAAEPLYQRTQERVEAVYRLVPEFRQIHPVAAGLADECRVVTEQAFWGGGLASLGTTPAYADWCLSADASYAYDYHRQVLGLIAGTDPRTWLLKCPIHIWGLDALLRTYPDANIVFMHRDVTQALSSTASMVYLLRKLRDPGALPHQVGREVLRNWGRALLKAETVRVRHPDARILDVGLPELQADPLATAARIYRYFGLDLPANAREPMARFLARDPSAQPGGHRYTAEYFGLSRDAVESAVGAYLQRNQVICGLQGAVPLRIGSAGPVT